MSSSQQDLFGEPLESARADVPGFVLRASWIDEAEERRLLAAIDGEPWDADWKRRVQVYGLGYGGGYGGASSRASWLRDLPAWVMPLCARLEEEQVLPRFPENVVVNEYMPGTGIGPHRDYPAFGDTIACVSLGSPILLDLVHPGLGTKVTVDVAAQSLWVMSGDARRVWQHAIAARKADVVNGARRLRGRRVSITFRTARGTSVPEGVVRGRRVPGPAGRPP